MVSSVAAKSENLENLVTGLSPEDAQRVLSALDFVAPHFENVEVVTGQNALQFARGVALTLSALRTDADTDRKSVV